MSNQKGFTIIELLIATSVVSVILLLTSVMMINIGNLYYKGISQTRAQTDVRAITNEIAEKLKHSGTPAQTSGVSADGLRRLCVYNTAYTYIIGRRLDTNQHVLWRDTISPGATCPTPTLGFLNTPTPITPGRVGADPGTELVGPRTRLTVFNVSSPSPYRINVGIAVGEDDQLQLIGGVWRCANQASDSYCATANLRTSVVSRL